MEWDLSEGGLQEDVLVWRRNEMGNGREGNGVWAVHTYLQ